MIRINKPAEIPEILETKGKAKRRGMSAAFSRFETDYRSGAKTFEFDNKIYGDETVKKALRDAQNDKCFLCESKISHISYGDVEHFRPKAGYRQTKDEALQKPGYYWLASNGKICFSAVNYAINDLKGIFFP